MRPVSSLGPCFRTSLAQMTKQALNDSSRLRVFGTSLLLPEDPDVRSNSTAGSLDSCGTPVAASRSIHGRRSSYPTIGTRATNVSYERSAATPRARAYGEPATMRRMRPSVSACARCGSRSASLNRRARRTLDSAPGQGRSCDPRATTTQPLTQPFDCHGQHRARVHARDYRQLVALAVSGDRAHEIRDVGQRQHVRCNWRDRALQHRLLAAEGHHAALWVPGRVVAGLADRIDEAALPRRTRGFVMRPVRRKVAHQRQVRPETGADEMPVQRLERMPQLPCE